MTFEEILPYIKEGKKAIRSGWSGFELFIEMKKELCLSSGDCLTITPYFLIKTSDEGYSMFTPTTCDILANDWQIVSN